MELDSPFLGVPTMINSTIQTIAVSPPKSRVNNNKHSLNLSLVRLNPLVLLPSRYKELHRSNGIGFRKRGGKRGREIFGEELEAGYRFWYESIDGDERTNGITMVHLSSVLNGRILRNSTLLNIDQREK